MNRERTICLVNPTNLTDDDLIAFGKETPAECAGWWVAEPAQHATAPAWTSADGYNSDWFWDGPYRTQQEAEVELADLEG